MTIVLYTFLLLLCAAASLFLSGRVRDYLVRRSVLDIPNERSSHTAPVPRGGGWALVFLLLPLTILFAVCFGVGWQVAPLCLGFALLVCVSWLDDRGHVSPLLRLTSHLAAATLGCLSLPPEAVILGGAVPVVVERIALVVGWAWFMNLYNFMDGIDGITGVETIFICGGTIVIMTIVGIADPFVVALSLAMIGGCFGFLRYNWHPARMFLGDVGSVPLGYLAGFCLIMLAVKGQMAAAFILPLYYLADSGITLGKRAWRREKVWQAHRQHFYQQAARGLKRHDRVVFRVICCDICLLTLAVGAIFYPWFCVSAAIVCVAVLLQKLHKSGSVVVEVT